MTLDKARERLRINIDLGDVDNRNCAKLILAEVSELHGQQAVDNLISEFNLQQALVLKTGHIFRT